MRGRGERTALKEKVKIAVIGGGAAGAMAAGMAAQDGAQVLLFEKNAKLGRKLYITGKGRCNLTNACDVPTVLANVPRNPRFLYSALHAFGPEAVQAFFKAQGVALKTERGGRVFPVSDRAADIVDALYRFIKQAGVQLVVSPVEEILTRSGRISGVRAYGKSYPADHVILATGGASYPLTGSTGDGYRFAQALGHTVVAPAPSLVPLVEQGAVCREMMGLSLRNVQVTAFENKKKIFSDQGEMLFTHFGVSGPLILSASAHMRRFEDRAYRLEIDLKPALDENQLNRRLLHDFEEHKNSDFINALGALLPRKLIPVIVERSGIGPRTKVHSVTREQRQALIALLKHFEIKIAGPRPLAEAIVTTGGVSVKEVDPATMASKKVPGLYFAGEVLDVDAYTGGFNLQIAWSTGFAAGHAAAYCQNEREDR